MPRRAGPNACLTCRRRKIRCDEKLLVCNNCARRCMKCDRSSGLTFRTYSRNVLPNQAPADVDNIEPRTLLQTATIADLFHTYIKDLAPWYDLNDERRTFETSASRTALDDVLLFSAIIAFAGAYCARKGLSTRQIAEEYHDRCLRLLIKLLQSDPAASDGTALASTCLLRSYEILVEDEDPNRHLFGASALIPYIPLVSDRSLEAAGFWNYLREDITYCLIHSQPLKVRLELVDYQAVEDGDYANETTLLLARIVNNYFARGSENYLAELTACERRSPVVSYARIESEPFPTIKMLKDCHVAATQYLHVARCMLEPQHAPRLAVEICALAMSAQSDPVVVNSYGPICFAARWLREPAQQERLLLWLERSQRSTAWSVKGIIDNLKKSWSDYGMDIL